MDALGPPARPLVLAKLQAPVPRERVSRPVLLDLCKGHRRKLTLVRAPAGWGKSTLLADWHASTDETRPFAWLALDQADNDPATFWTYVIEALRTQHAVSGDRSLATLQAPRVDVITDVLPDAVRRARHTAARRGARPGRLPPGHQPRDRREPRVLRRAPAEHPRDRAGEPVRAIPAPGPAPRARRPRGDRRARSWASPTRRRACC